MTAEEQIYEAVDASIAKGVSPRQFVSIAAQAWQAKLSEDKNYAAKEFERLLRIPLSGGPA